MCEILGLTYEGTTNIPTQGSDCQMDEQGNDNKQDNELGKILMVLPFLLVMPY
jgi:hypothetical protein